MFAIVLASLLDGCPAPQLPPVSVADLLWLPGREATQAQLVLAYEHLTWLRQASQDRLAARTCPHRCGEAERLHEAWDALDDAWRGSCPHACAAGREQHLERLRSIIGVAAYISGQMPPPVPIWRFQIN